MPNLLRKMIMIPITMLSLWLRGSFDATLSLLYCWKNRCLTFPDMGLVRMLWGWWPRRRRTTWGASLSWSSSWSTLLRWWASKKLDGRLWGQWGASHGGVGHLCWVCVDAQGPGRLQEGWEAHHHAGGHDWGGGRNLWATEHHHHTLGLWCHVPRAHEGGGRGCQDDFLGFQGLGEVWDFARETFAAEGTETKVEDTT